MPKSNQVQKAAVKPTTGVAASTIPSQPVSIEVPGTGEMTLLKGRVNALEAAIDSLMRDISRLKQIPSELVTHQSIMDRLAEKIDSINNDLQQHAVEEAKPKKRWGIF